MKTNQFIGLQKDIYKALQNRGFIMSDIDFKYASSGQKECIFKAVLLLLDIPVNNREQFVDKNGKILDTSFE
jgi:hypothetical protein